MRTARGFELMAINIEEHVGNYMPGHWRETIRTVTSVPLITEDKARRLVEAYQNGTLPVEVKTLTDNPNVAAGFYDFFWKTKLEPYLAEVKLP